MKKSMTRRMWNYLRVRGEYSKRRCGTRMLRELPPRARRILNNVFPRPFNAGTTSACAENTYMKKSMTRRMWNYLRVRGEYSNPAVGTIAHQELPPRARRIPFSPRCIVGRLGTTSACAENT